MVASLTDSGRAPARSDSAGGRGLGWTVMILFVFLAVVLGLGALLIQQMQSMARAADLQAFQRLAITSQSFAGWPGVAEQVGRRSLPIVNAAGERPAIEAIHPQFGRLPLRYYWGDRNGCRNPLGDTPAASPEKAPNEPATPAGSGAEKAGDVSAAPRPARIQRPNGSDIYFGTRGLIVWGRTMTFDRLRGRLVSDAVDAPALNRALSLAGPQDDATPVAMAGGAAPAQDPRYVCYRFGPIPYQNALAVPEGFQALLLFDDPGTDGNKPSELVAHVGADILPIRDTSDIPDLQRLLHRAAAAEVKPGANPASADYIASVAGSVLGEGKSEFLTPLDVTIAGRSYRLYVYPVSFSLGSATKHMLVVGATMPRPSFVTANLNGSRFALCGLFLAGLIALTPLIRVANLGPVDGITRFDLFVIAGSLALGTAIAATISFLAVDTVRTKRQTDIMLQTQASSLASKIGTEIFDISSCSLGAVGAAVADEGRQVPGARPMVFKEIARKDWKPCGRSPAWADIPSAARIAHPDVILFMDQDGLPPWTPTDGPVPIGAYTKRPGPFYRLEDRHYFARANDRDVVAGTEALAYRLANSLDIASPRPGEKLVDGAPPPGGRCNGARCGIAIEQILSRGDGIPKTMMSLPIEPCGPAQTRRILCKTHTRVVAIGFVMKTMLAPVLPAGVRYAVVDLSQRPDMPSIFHSDPERANAERFSLSLDPGTLARFKAAIRMPTTPCANGDARRMPGATSFSGSYIGEDQRFAVALAPCTEWAVVLFRPDAVTDGQGAFPAQIAFLSWLGMALPCALLFGVTIIVARRVSPIRLRMLWPDPLLERAYLRMAAWLGAYGALAILAFAIGIPSGIVLLSIPIACAAAIAYLFWSSMGSDGETRRHEEMRVHKRVPILGRSAEIAYVVALGTWLFVSSALPVGVIAIDAARYGAARQQAENGRADSMATERLRRSLALIYASQFAGSLDAPLPRDAPLPSPGPLAIDTGRFDYTAGLFCLLGHEPCPPSAAAPKRKAAIGAFDAPGGGAAPSGEAYGLLFSVTWLLVAIPALLLPFAMVRILCRTLFGFGVPLESVRYPRIRPGPDRGLIYSDARSEDVVWEVRYPGSFVLRPNWDREALRDFYATPRTHQDRAILRIQAADWARDPQGLAAVLKLALFGQRRLKQAEITQLRAELRLQRDPREAGYFRIILIQPATSPLPDPDLPTPAAAAPPVWIDLLETFRDEDAPPYDEDHAPVRAVLVAGPDDFRRRLLAYAGERVIDLYEVRDRSFLDIEPLLPATPPVADAPLPLVIVHNLELLIRDDPARKNALKLLENLVREQDRRASGKSRQPRQPFRLLLLADISPLDRFLQATEWRDVEEEAGQPDPADDPAENIRWSRLLEDFTTYTGRVEPRLPTTRSSGATLRSGGDGVDFLLRELAYLPDRVVQALLPDHDDILHESEIREWGVFLKDTRPAAIADFLASQLIEHYHYLWSISSRAEQILIHRIAAGELPVIRKAYALRSLVRRGIVVLDPAPRLMNHSFGRFVGSVERPELLRRWKREAPQGGWNRIHGNLTIVMPLILLLAGLLVARGIVGLEAAIPLIAAASSALLKPLLSGQRAPA